MTSNVQKWALTIVMAALGGIIQAASSPQPQHLQDFLRSAAIGMAPAIAALNITLRGGGDK